jgi:AraC family transcriptional regulator, arabinose operon regulatory protein
MNNYNKICANGFTVRMANFFTVGQNNNSWGPRIIPDYEFVYIVKGQAEYKGTSQTETIILKQDQVLLIPPHEEHVFSCQKVVPTIISCIHFSFKPTRRLPRQQYMAAVDPEILELFRKSAMEHDRKETFSHELLENYMREIWIRLNRLSAGSQQMTIEPIKVRQAKVYINDFYNRKISRQEIAQFLNITPEYLNYLFKQHVRSTPQRYIHEVRLQKAREMLRRAPHLNISQVGAAVGYDDPLYFSRVFKRKMGVSPRKYLQLL